MFSEALRALDALAAWHCLPTLTVGMVIGAVLLMVGMVTAMDYRGKGDDRV